MHLKLTHFFIIQIYLIKISLMRHCKQPLSTKTNETFKPNLRTNMSCCHHFLFIQNLQRINHMESNRMLMFALYHSICLSHVIKHFLILSIRKFAQTFLFHKSDMNVFEMLTSFNRYCVHLFSLFLRRNLVINKNSGKSKL